MKIIKIATKFVLQTMAVLALSTACQSTTTDTTKPKENKPTTFVCKDPRPEICTQEYMPVCATKDTGVRCITTPCPSTEKKTYSNACSACADAKVTSYTLGACKGK